MISAPTAVGDQIQDRGLPPFALEVDLGAVARRYDGAPDRPRRVHDERLGQLHHRELVAVGLVGLEHRELRRVGRVESLVAERAADLVDLLDAADHRALEVELDGDAQQHVLVEGVQVGAERPGRGPAVGQLQDRGLDLDVATLVERLAQAAQHGGLRAHHLARLRPDHHVDVAQPDAGLVGERTVLVGQRAQRLGRQRPLGGLHAQLAASAGDHLASYGEEVADVDERLELGQRLLAHLGEAEHHLDLGAVTLAEPGEAELAGVALEDHPAGDRDLLAGAGVGLELACLERGVVLLADLPDGVGALDNGRVWLLSGVEQPLPLLPSHLHLLGQVVGRPVVGPGGVGHGGQATLRSPTGRPEEQDDEGSGLSPGGAHGHRPP